MRVPDQSVGIMRQPFALSGYGKILGLGQAGQSGIIPAQQLCTGCGVDPGSNCPAKCQSRCFDPATGTTTIECCPPERCGQPPTTNECCKQVCCEAKVV